MAKIRFETGQVVNFDGDPTPQDIEEVAQKLNIRPAAVSTPPQPKTSFSNKIANFIGAKGITDQFGADIARFRAPEEQKDLVEYPKMREVIGSAVQTGANLIPGVGGVASKISTKVIAGAVTGATSDVGGNLQTSSKTVKESLIPGLGAVIGGGLPVLGKITGIAGLGKNLKKTSEAMERINLRLTPVEKQNLAKQGKDIIGYLAEKKIVGTPEQRYSQVVKLYDDMEKTVQGVIGKSKATYDKLDLIEELKGIPEKFSDDPASYEEVVRKVGSIVEFIGEKSPIKISGALLNTYKRNLFNRAYSKNNTDVVNEALHAVGSHFKDKLDNTIPELKKFNKEYGNIITSKKLLFKAQSRAQLGLVGKAVSATASGALGGLVGGPVGVAAGSVLGPAIGEVAAGTAARSLVGASARKLSDVVNKLPTDKFGNISKKTLLNLIQSLRD